MKQLLLAALLALSLAAASANAQTCQGLVNCSFETPSLGTSWSSYQYDISGVAGQGWAFLSSSGIEANGSAFGASNAPGGTQAAFLQGLGSISQTVSLGAG